MMSSNRIKLNIRGKMFEIEREQCKKYPDLLLSKLDKNHFSYCAQDKLYFFNKDPMVFNSVLNYCSTGHLHFPSYMCSSHVLEELEFWGLGEHDLNDCCWTRINENKALWQNVYKILAESTKKCASSLVNNKVGDDTEKMKEKSSLRHKIYQTMENPSYSIAAMVYNIVLFLVVLLSILLLIICTDPTVYLSMTKDEIYQDMHDNNFTSYTAYIRSYGVNVPTEYTVLEYLTTGFMAMDLLIKIIICPNKSELLSIHVLIDVLALIPPFASLILYYTDIYYSVFERDWFMKLESIIAALYVLRLCKLLKLTKHIQELRVLVTALRASLKEILLLLGIMAILSMIYGCLIYAFEYEAETFFSMGYGIWWAVITMTTVGYGDYYPKSGAGCCFAAIVALTGIVIISLPIPVIANNFHYHYTSYKLSSNLKRRQKARLHQAGKSGILLS